MVDGERVEPYESLMLEVGNESIGVLTENLAAKAGPDDEHAQRRRGARGAGVRGPDERAHWVPQLLPEGDAGRRDPRIACSRSTAPCVER